jgi:hypothetical protein
MTKPVIEIRSPTGTHTDRLVSFRLPLFRAGYYLSTTGTSLKVAFWASSLSQRIRQNFVKTPFSCTTTERSGLAGAK